MERISITIDEEDRIRMNRIRMRIYQGDEHTRPRAVSNSALFRRALEALERELDGQPTPSQETHDDNV